MSSIRVPGFPDKEVTDIRYKFGGSVFGVTRVLKASSGVVYTLWELNDSTFVDKYGEVFYDKYGVPFQGKE